MKMLEKVIKESKEIIKGMRLGIDTDIPITLNGRLSRSLGRTLKNNLTKEYKIEIGKEFYNYCKKNNDYKTLLSVMVHEMLHLKYWNHGSEFNRMAKIIEKRHNLDKIHGTTIVTNFKKNQSNYKYEVYCPDCSSNWKYKTLCKSVTQAHSYRCGCGCDGLLARKISS